MSDFNLTPWRAKKLPDSDSLAYLVPDADIRVDGAKMCVKVIVSTPTMDRERDIMVPKGCRTKSHEKNPIVLLNHQRQLPGIGVTRDPAGNYTVKTFEDRIESTNYFDQGSKMAMQAFRAVESGALGGISPGFLTVPDHVHKVKGSDGHPAFMYTAWDLVEISHCPIGMNPDAIVLAIEKGYGGEQLVPELKELLLPFVPEKKAQVVGGWDARLIENGSDGTTTNGGMRADNIIDLSDADAVPLTPSTQFYHTLYQKAWDCLELANELTNVQELDRTRADGKRIIGLVGGVLDVCQKGHNGHVSDFPDQPGLPDGLNSDVMKIKMAKWRVKALDMWDEHKRKRALAVAAEHTADIAEVLRFCQTVAADRLQKTGVRAIAKSMAARLANVKMVSAPTDEAEEAEWGAVAAKLDKVLVKG